MYWNVINIVKYILRYCIKVKQTTAGRLKISNLLWCSLINSSYDIVLQSPQTQIFLASDYQCIQLEDIKYI